MSFSEVPTVLGENGVNIKSPLVSFFSSWTLIGHHTCV